MEMLLNALTIGQVFKNFKALCQHFGLQAKTGNARNAQVKEFKRYFDWEQQGQRITITVIHDTPQEKVDGRKGNGHKNFNEILGDKRGHRQRTIPIKLIYGVLGYVYRNSTEDVIVVSVYETLEQLGICGQQARYLISNKQDLYYTSNIEWEVLDLVLGNLYSSMRDKVLCPGINIDKKITFSNGTSRLATKKEKELIQQAEEQAIIGTKFKKYGDIYTMANKEQRQLVQQNKKLELEKLIPNYCTDLSCFVIQRSVLDTSVDYETAEQLKQQINTLFYEHEVLRIEKNYDNKICAIKNRRSYGNIKKLKLENCQYNKQQAKKLLGQALKIA